MSNEMTFQTRLLLLNFYEVFCKNNAWSLCFYPEFLQWAEPGVETVLRQAAGQEVDPRLLWSLPVHLFRIHIKVLQ